MSIAQISKIPQQEPNSMQRVICWLLILSSTPSRWNWASFCRQEPAGPGLSHVAGGV